MFLNTLDIAKYLNDFPKKWVILWAIPVYDKPHKRKRKLKTVLVYYDNQWGIAENIPKFGNVLVFDIKSYWYLCKSGYNFIDLNCYLYANLGLDSVIDYEIPDIYNGCPPITEYLKVDFSGINFTLDKKPGRAFTKYLFTLWFIEKQGIFKEKLQYSDYKIFTKTGRPSNSYDGYNFAAIPHNDRQIFTSRFGDDGILYEYDFSNFHVNICYLLGKNYNLITDNFYQTAFPNLDKDRAKSLTFQTLYGNLISDSQYLSELLEFKKRIVSEYRENNYIVTPLSGSKLMIDDDSDNKIFNYFLQRMETEFFLSHIFKLVKDFAKSKSKIALYCYDSILVDYHKDEELYLHEIVLNKIGFLPLKFKKGPTFSFDYEKK